MGTDMGRIGSDSPKECAFSRKRLHPPSQTFATLLVALACDWLLA